MLALCGLSTANTLLAASESTHDAETYRTATDELYIGHAYEAAKRLDDAEAAYRKALEIDNDRTRVDAGTSLTRVIRLRASAGERYLSPVWDTCVKGLQAFIAAVLLIILVSLLGVSLKRYYRHQQENCLGIDDFANSGDSGVPGERFRETLTFMHERISLHFRQTAVIGDAGKMPILLGSSSSDLLDVIAAVDDSALPFAKWFSKLMRQPGYRISGWTESSDWSIKVYAKLEHTGEIIRQWNEIYPRCFWLESEQDLAYEIIMRLKGYTHGHAS